MPKPFDQIFKEIAEGDPRGLLDPFGSLPLGVEAKVEIVDREQVVESLYVDQAFRVETESGAWIEHFEVTTSVPADLKDRFAKYGFLLGMGSKLPVKSSLILLSPRHAPKTINCFHVLDLGTVRIEVEFRVIRLWELDAGKILGDARPELLPFVPAVNSSEEQLAMAAERIRATGDIAMRAAFRMLGGLRFGKNDWKLILERLPAMWWTEQIVRDSSLYEIVRDMGVEEGIAQGVGKGIEQGREQGQMEARRGDIRRCLKLRFPSIGALEELDAISDLAKLDELFENAVTTPRAELFFAMLRGDAARQI